MSNDLHHEIKFCVFEANDVCCKLSLVDSSNFQRTGVTGLSVGAMDRRKE